ncbi:MAG: tetratricopeptide repeat protein [Sphingomonadales bacterium]
MRNETPDLGMARKFQQEGIDTGCPYCEYSLATWYLHSMANVVPKDAVRAIPLLKSAADKGLALACFDLAVCYETGAGVQKSEKTAFQYYMEAALLGDVTAYEEVGRMYFHGIGVTKDMALAEIWLRSFERLSDCDNKK